MCVSVCVCDCLCVSMHGVCLWGRWGEKTERKKEKDGGLKVNGSGSRLH